MIIHKQSFGCTFTFIVTTTDTDRVHISPIRFYLRMNGRIAIHFTGRSLENLCFGSFSHPQHIHSSVNGGFHCLDGIILIMGRRCRTSQVIDLIDLGVIRRSYIMTNQLKVVILQQVTNIILTAGKIIIQANHIIALSHQAFA